jgi:hypothetical protein
VQLEPAVASCTAWCTSPSRTLPLQTQQQQHRPAPCSNSSNMVWTTQSSQSIRDLQQDQQMWGSHFLRTWREARGPALQVGMLHSQQVAHVGWGCCCNEQQVHYCICTCMHQKLHALPMRAFAAPSCRQPHKCSQWHCAPHVRITPPPPCATAARPFSPSGFAY